MKRERKTRVRLIPKTETCITEWERAVKAYLKQGMAAREAVRKAYEEHPVMHELLTEVRERGEMQLKSGYGKPIPRKVAQKALEIPWAEDGLKLSERTTKGANLVRNWAARTIAKAIRNGDTAQELTRRLYDGFNFKGGKEILPAQDIPRYLRDLVNVGRKVDGYDAEYRNLLRRARSALERNEAGPLKAAYEEIIRAVETRSEKAIDKAVYVATQENTRYYARRIARTELQRAYQDGEFAQWTNDDDVVAFQWRTSSKHSDCDICDLYKEADLYGLGKGVFPKDKVPSLPLHPHCMCYLKPIMQGAEMLQGKTERNRVEQGGREYIDALSKRQREQLLGVNGSKEVLTGRVSWTAKARGYSTGVMKSRMREAQKSSIVVITEKYANIKKPSAGRLTYDKDYDIHKNKREIAVAQWLYEHIGGNIKLLTAVNKDNKKTPDYLWNGKYWDLKSISTEKAADSAIRYGLKQIQENPGGLVLQYTGEDADVDKLSNIASGRLRRGYNNPVEVIVLDKSGVLVVLKYRPEQ